MLMSAHILHACGSCGCCSHRHAEDCERIACCFIKIKNMFNMHMEHNVLIVSSLDTWSFQEMDCKEHHGTLCKCRWKCCSRLVARVSSLKMVDGEQLCEASPCYLLLRIQDHLIRMGVPVSTSQLWWVATGCKALPAVTVYSLWLQQASLWIFDLYRVSAEALRKNGWWEFDCNKLQG